jgi:hypothetical protein
VEEEETGRGEEAAVEQDISTKIHTHKQGLHCISQVMLFAIDSNSSAFMNYCIQLRTAFKKTLSQKLETSFSVGSVKEISMSCILEMCNVQCNRALICTLIMCYYILYIIITILFY